MKPATKITTLLMTLVLLAGCSGKEAESLSTAPRPVKTFVVGGEGERVKRRFPGRVDAKKRADLAFRVSGTLMELPVKEGDSVAEGQVLARLDPETFETVIKNREAIYNRVRADYNRAKELIEDGYISRSDYDRLESEYRQASAALQEARLELSYTELSAPFAGVIARRLTQNFEAVQVQQPILQLRDLDMLEIRFGVPEIIVRDLAEVQGADVSVSAEFEASEQSFPLTFREFASTADPATQTFEAIYTMPRPENLEVLPGMTVTVVADLTLILTQDSIYSVPVTAVIGDAALGAQVWVVDEESMTVSPRAVSIGRLTGSQIEILDGLVPGERVVQAGTGYLTAGMKVALLTHSEQAEDNIVRTPPNAR